ncbi:MAG TPA: redoxin domain-containing protein [Candidatus Limnocylindrales bacterium]|nr:redoxin domain-containing protein [Candidatus Limnocylindrales bacterium]
MKIAQRMNWTVVLFIAFPILFAAAGIMLGVARNSVPAAATQTIDYSRIAGTTAPDFTVEDLSGQRFHLNERTKPVLVELFATWCGHCKEAVPAMNQVYAKYKNRVDFISIAATRYAIDGTSPASLDDTRRFARNLHIRYPVAYDPSHHIAKQYMIGVVPTIALVATDRKVIVQTGGDLSAKDLGNIIDRALK